MTKWATVVCSDPSTLNAEVKKLDNTVIIHIVPYKAGSSDHFLLIHNGG